MRLLLSLFTLLAMAGCTTTDQPKGYRYILVADMFNQAEIAAETLAGYPHYISYNGHLFEFLMSRYTEASHIVDTAAVLAGDDRPRISPAEASITRETIDTMIIRIISPASKKFVQLHTFSDTATARITGYYPAVRDGVSLKELAQLSANLPKPAKDSTVNGTPVKVWRTDWQPADSSSIRLEVFALKDSSFLLPFGAKDSSSQPILPGLFGVAYYWKNPTYRMLIAPYQLELLSAKDAATCNALIKKYADQLK